MASAHSNGAAGIGSSNGGEVDILSQIHQALEVVHAPYSANGARREAQEFLENVKAVDEAPFHGYTLASNKSQPAVVRHYALSLLDNAIKHKWADYTTEQASTLRGWMLELCQGISQADPLYIRNKTAQLWVEVAKRSWGTEWMDMDELLVQLWQVPDSAVHKELVMTVLETLGYETFFGDDVVVAMRQGVLCKGWTEITTPTAVLAEAIKNRNPAPEVRYGDEGWLVRLVTLLEQCLNGDINGNSEVRSCAVKALSVLSTLMPCTIPKGTAASKVVPVASRALAASQVSVQKGALEVLHALYSRDDFYDEEFAELVAPMYEQASVGLLKELFNWSVVDAEDIDDDKYQFAKKFSEVRMKADIDGASVLTLPDAVLTWKLS
ncbi:hypothetical protein VDGD_21114 [Verticillium dahliae]|nr:hypothetical protein VDGD_21114 [Verticillium dahliae]